MTREEAIKEIKSWAIPSKNGRKVLETLIPELAESEDERTRKEIIHYILYKADGVSEEQEHSWIAYLEKQKDLDKMIVVSPEVWDKAISDAYENGKKDEEKQKEQKPDSLIYDKDLDKAAREFYLSGGAASPVDSTGLVPIVRMAEFGATWMKERMEKEQKPCWNPTEEDVALFNKAITTNASLSPQERAKLDILRMKFKHRPVIEQKEQKPAECADDVVEEAEEYTSKVDCGEYGAEVTEAYIAGVLAERNRGIEWNEEDEKDMTHIIRILDDCYAYGKHDLSKTDHENLVNKLLVIKLLVIKLKSLRPQLKQNDMITPNKEFFQWIYNRLVDVHKENPNVDYMISFKRRIEELSFDKPSWKPSEEQPEVDLEKEIEDYCGAYENRPVSDFIETVARHFYKLGLNARKEE